MTHYQIAIVFNGPEIRRVRMIEDGKAETTVERCDGRITEPCYADEGECSGGLCCHLNERVIDFGVEQGPAMSVYKALATSIMERTVS